MTRRIDLSDEQVMLGETAERFLRERYGFEHREAIRASESGMDADMWRAFAEMGWLSLPFAERHGGWGGTMLDVALLTERLGAALVAEPYIPTVVAGGTALLAASEAQQDHYIPRIIAGQLRLALAIAEPDGPTDPFATSMRAVRSPGGFLLSGTKTLVVGAPHADLLVVSALAVDIGEAVSLFLVPADAPGVSLRSYATLDGRRAAEVVLHEVELGRDALIGEHGAARPIVERAVNASIVAYLGEAAGVLQAAVDVTAAYLNTREQFGRKLSSFQALRHRIARMYVMKEEVRALCRQAAAAFADDPEGPDAREAIHAAKAMVGTQGRVVCEELVQLHGAIAITDEYVGGHYLKRILVIDRLYGDASYHRDRFLAVARTLEVAGGA